MPRFFPSASTFRAAAASFSGPSVFSSGPALTARCRRARARPPTIAQVDARPRRPERGRLPKFAARLLPSPQSEHREFLPSSGRPNRADMGRNRAAGFRPIPAAHVPARTTGRRARRVGGGSLRAHLRETRTVRDFSLLPWSALSMVGRADGFSPANPLDNRVDNRSGAACLSRTSPDHPAQDRERLSANRGLMAWEAFSPQPSNARSL
jgi:hypothetical protein